MKTKLLILVTALLLSFNAFAISLQDAKSQGLVGEQLNGYLGVVNNSQGAGALVKQVNAQRKTFYSKIAAKNGLSTQAVADLAADKAIKATKKGQYIQNANGVWSKK